MRIDVGAATDLGRVREVNEDSYLVEAPLYAVADGMGGHRGGDVASSLALETVEALFREGDGHARRAGTRGEPGRARAFGRRPDR